MKDPASPKAGGTQPGVTGSEQAQQLIAEAATNGRTELSLSHLGLTAVPNEIRGLECLQILDLRHNAIRQIPNWIQELPRLKYLDLVRNPLDSIPNIPGLKLDWEVYRRLNEFLSPSNILGLEISIGHDQRTKGAAFKYAWRLETLAQELPQLEELRIGVDGISLETPLKIPRPDREILQLVQSLDQFPTLTKLTLFGMALGQVPESIRHLRKLTALGLDGIDINSLPPWISGLANLRQLSLALNNLEGLPGSFAEMQALKTFVAFRNRFVRFPEVLFDLPLLCNISLGCMGSVGRIREIPYRINELRNLVVLDVDGHPIETPPLEVVKQGLHAIKSYWRQRKESGVDYLCEAKLLLIGEPGAGKTSLANKIIDPTYKLEQSEPSTEGIEVSSWRFPTAVRLGDRHEEKIATHEFRVNIWDFGGQEIYHATHQFFLTRRSVYALVVDDRKEDTDFNYWLHIVELLSDGSPLLIVQNEKQGRRRDINSSSLRARFANLKITCSINLATNQGLDGLVAAIRLELEHLPHIGTPLPQTWKRVRETLEDDPRNYITQDEYLAICDKHGFTRHEDKLQLSGYLHDLGICLHFQDDAVLKNTVILKPRWGTAAVYQVLDDHDVINYRGRFGDEDLKRIWWEHQFASMRHELLRLMMRFELCYQLNNSTYIAPQLLSPVQPAYEWKEQNALTLRYEYDFMPKGLLTRLIVSLHHLIDDQSSVWKTGVVFRRDETRAEVIEDYPRRKITVRASGADVRSLMAIIDDQLERIHGTFSRLQYEKFLPCNCETCREREDPFSYPLRDLKDFARSSDSIQCRYSRKLVDAAGLIREIFPAALSEDRLMATPGTHEESHVQASTDLSKEVFVSYAWGGESSSTVDKLEQSLHGKGITLLRDRNQLKYRDAIQEFMKRIGQGKCIVVVLSKKYLESKNCMFELTEIAARGDIRDRVFPIILKDANVFDALGRLQYIHYWETKKQELDTHIKQVGGENLSGIRNELDQFARVRSTLDGLMDILADMNCLTPEEHEDSDFAELVSSLEQRLGK
jgi:Leucine-rich repeat (LRR) protein